MVWYVCIHIDIRDTYDKNNYLAKAVRAAPPILPLLNFLHSIQIIINKVYNQLPAGEF